MLRKLNDLIPLSQIVYIIGKYLKRIYI